MNMRFDYLSNYIEDPIELRHYRERNNLSFEEEINTCTTDSLKNILLHSRYHIIMNITIDTTLFYLCPLS